jgi:hypothetical protein
VTFDWRRRRVVAVLALGLGLRLGYAWHGFHANYLPTSSDGYETIALSMLDRGEYAMDPGVPTSMREPSYPLFIAGIYAVFGRHPGLIIFLHCLLSVATGWFLFLTGRRLLDEDTAWAALAVFMLYPQSVYYCAYFFRESWLCFWFGLMLYQSVFWSAPAGDPAGDRGAWLGGAAAAVFGLGNSAVLPACALSGLLLWFAAPKITRVRRFAFYTLPLVLAFGAWTARNYAVQMHFVAGSTHGGVEFYRALIVPPELQNSSKQIEILRADPLFDQTAKFNEFDQNQAFMKASFAWIAAHPATFISRAFAGYMKYWKLWPYRYNYQHSYFLLVLASLLSDGWIVPLGFLGAWLLRRRWRELPALPASIFAMTFVYGTVHAVIRYRLPLMGGMILLACAAVSSFLRSRPKITV